MYPMKMKKTMNRAKKESVRDRGLREIVRVENRMRKKIVVKIPDVKRVEVKILVRDGGVIFYYLYLILLIQY